MLYRFCDTHRLDRSFITRNFPASRKWRPFMYLLEAVQTSPIPRGTPQGVQADAITPRPAVDSPPPAVSDVPMDVVYIKGFTAHTVIGIDVSELRDPQPVRINLTIGVPSIRACATDRIEDTVNYAAVHDALHGLLATHGVQLLERVAGKISLAC